MKFTKYNQPKRRRFSYFYNQEKERKNQSILTLFEIQQAKEKGLSVELTQEIFLNKKEEQ